jgi:NAD+ synthetase
MDSFQESCGVVELTSFGTWVEKPGIGSFLQREPKPISEVELKYEQAILGIRDYMGKCKVPFTTAIIGLSGGIDSAIVSALAARAVGSENVVCILMPNFPISSQGSVDDAIQFCENFGIKYFIDPISEAYQAWIQRYTAIYGKEPNRLTKENWQARERGKTLMAYSNDIPCSIVLATGNKSETSVGYCTTFGDMCGGLNPIGDLYKTDVREICWYHNEVCREMKIPEVIITKGPSAELSEGQMDTDSLPPYEILDPILRLYIESHVMTESEKQSCISALAMTSSSIVGRVLKMVDASEYKRQISTVILRIRQVAFGDGRQFPITGQYFDEKFCMKLLHRPTSGEW